MKYQSRQYLFSTTATPATLGIIKALDLIDEEPEKREKLWQNIRYFKQGLGELGLNVGGTSSAIIPLKVGNIAQTLEIGKKLLKAGIYANPIMYPAVSKKDARIRFNLMATHEYAHFDKVFQVLEDIDKSIGIPKLDSFG